MTEYEKFLILVLEEASNPNVGRPLCYKVILRNMGRLVRKEADPFLAANIVPGERVYCRDPYSADEYELYILRRAGDLAPLKMERLSLIFNNAP